MVDDSRYTATRETLATALCGKITARRDLSTISAKHTYGLEVELGRRSILQRVVTSSHAIVDGALHSVYTVDVKQSRRPLRSVQTNCRLHQLPCVSPFLQQTK